MDARALEQVSAAFLEDEFSYSAERYATHIRQLLKLGTPAQLAERYFDLLERMLEMLWDCATPKLTSTDRETIFGLVVGNWNPSLAPHRRASLLAIVGYLLPHPGVREWLLAEADKTTGSVSMQLRKTAEGGRATGYMV